jgi:hypothetical protein
LNDPESYAGGGISSGRASHNRQFKDNDPDKKEYSGSPSWGWGMGLTTSPYKICSVEKLLRKKRLRSTKGCNARRRNRAK